MAIKPIEKANTLESFIEVVNALNKLKINDLIQEILDDDDEYLIRQGYCIKAGKELLETPKKLRALSLKQTFWMKKCKKMFLLYSRIKF